MVGGDPSSGQVICPASCKIQILQWHPCFQGVGQTRLEGSGGMCALYLHLDSVMEAAAYHTSLLAMGDALHLAFCLRHLLVP